MIDSSSKTFVLDTNVLLHNPNALFAFADNHVVIPITVLEELDKFKTGGSELGRNSREVVRMLDRLRQKGSLREGIPTDSGGLVQVVLRYDELSGLLPGLNDNRILGCAHGLKREGHQVVFVSKDINARIKGDALGLACEDFENQKVNIDELYRGWRTLTMPSKALEEFESSGSLPISPDSLNANEYALLVDADDRKHTVLGRYHRPSKHLKRVDALKAPLYGITPRNLEQRIAVDLLMDDSIKLLSLVGSAGTGKTLLAIACGMQKVLRDSVQSKLLVSRPVIPLGKDIGYLPGTKDEKLTHWMGPIFDNLQFILGAEERDPDEVIKRLLKDETITLEALTYIRGRSISNHFLIVDEAQNLTPHEIKTIISRAGVNTRIVLTGDPYQIDNPYLDASSNGLTYLVDRMRGQEISGHITLAKAERSPLAGLAAELL
ncbi:MAG: PhoH family protein [Planctomycetota bacterium]|nr:MAG: PhoH family protein [Planctomycetota bacterium]